MTEDIRTSIRQLISKAKAMIPPDNLPDLPPGKYTGSAPDWYPFERHVGAIGEEIRQLILQKKSLRKVDRLRLRYINQKTIKKRS